MHSKLNYSVAAMIHFIIIYLKSKSTKTVFSMMKYCMHDQTAQNGGFVYHSVWLAWKIFQRPKRLVVITRTKAITANKVPQKGYIYISCIKPLETLPSLV